MKNDSLTYLYSVHVTVGGCIFTDSAALASPIFMSWITLATKPLTVLQSKVKLIYI